MDIFVLRHGDAGKRLPSASKDAERSLTAAGKKEVENVADSLEQMGVEFDRIVTSPLRRAKETAAVVAKQMKVGDHLEDWDELKPEGNVAELYSRLAKLPQDSSVLMVGHNPYLSTFIGEVISGNNNCRIDLKKAGMARIRVTSTGNPKFAGELRWLLTPKQLKRMA
jgi:phosphohistidine phosphatase